jgi:hypothetical protein
VVKVRLPTHRHDGLNGDRGVSLSAERLALVQRYMVDAEEAKALELRAAEEQARREVEERLAREADRRRVLAEAAERRAAPRDGIDVRPPAPEAAAPPEIRLPPAPHEAPPAQDPRSLKALQKADRRAAKEAARQVAAAERREARERKALAKAIAKRQARERKELAKLMAKRGT